MGDVSISAQELKEQNPQFIPKLAGDLSRSDFWYYTRLTTADQILDGNSFWVNRISNMNDLDEMDLHYQEKDKIFALCFCNSNTEKIPMWYLYSGITGKGAALGLTPGCMHNFLRSLEEVEGIKEDDTKETLKINRDIYLQFGRVYYQDQHDHKRIMYKGKWYELSNPADFENNNYFIKKYPWEYEMEFRLVFINRTNIAYKRLIVNIPESMKSRIKLRLAPELSIKELFKIKGLNYINNNMSPVPIQSELKIQMDLLRRNKNSLPEYLPEYLKEEFTESNPAIQPETLCQLIQDTSKCPKSIL